MANVQGVRLTLPDGTEFFGKGDVQMQIEHQHNWLLSGGSTVIGFAGNLFNEAGGPGSGIMKTQMATGHLGSAGGSRTFEINFSQWVGNADSWGPAASGDSIAEKMAVLDNELARSGVDSLNPATLEFGPHSSTTSRYDPIPIVVTQISPMLDFQESANTFTPNVTFVETIDLSQAIDGSASVTADYELDSAGTSTTIPLAADTLGAGGRGTGRLQQGWETAPSKIAQKNAASSASADPTTQNDGVTPASGMLTGAFRGSNAKTLADSLQADFLSNVDVEQVTISIPSGSSVSTPSTLTGTYVLGESSYVDPIVPQVDGGVFGYQLDLQEV